MMTDNWSWTAQFIMTGCGVLLFFAGVFVMALLENRKVKK